MNLRLLPSVYLVYNLSYHPTNHPTSSIWREPLTEHPSQYQDKVTAFEWLLLIVIDEAAMPEAQGHNIYSKNLDINQIRLKDNVIWDKHLPFQTEIQSSIDTVH